MLNSELKYCICFIILCLLAPILSIESFIVWAMSLLFIGSIIKTFNKNSINLKEKLTKASFLCISNAGFAFLFNFLVNQGTRYIIAKFF